ncbi:MAG: DUF5627 domain-containing protein [Bacteroidales bacterium]|jgi:hypothetical protein|nr:DUF5627 domain-containing protein [Bacteroidales bacterium]
MKKIIKLTRLGMIVLGVASLASCKNFDREFPDFDYTTGYFPYQYPVRTLILGNYIYDNSNDNAHRFLITAAMGGVRENTEKRAFRFVVDYSLCNNAYFDDSNAILPLPADYYTLVSPEGTEYGNVEGEIVIPAGQLNGSVEVRLTDAFFDDPLAIGNHYVVPLRIIETSNIDSLLQGLPLGASGDCRIAGQWATVPMDFTMFGIKFVNPWHGTWLHSGHATLKDAATGNLLGENSYRAAYVEENELWTLTTSGRKSATLTGDFKIGSPAGTGDPAWFDSPFMLSLQFESDNHLTEGGIACTVSSGDGACTVNGNGKYTVDAETYGGKKRDAIYLSYTLSNGSYTYSATDTLVFRDKGVKLETYTPIIH